MWDILWELQARVPSRLAPVAKCCALQPGGTSLDLSQIIQSFQKGKEGGPQNYSPVSFTRIPGKLKEQLILSVISKHLEEKKVVRISQYGFTGRKYLTNLISFCYGMTVWVDEMRMVNVVPLDFIKSFDTVSHNILRGKLRK
ncbi:RNA-directed DNA polymerase from mobile element jockey-like protein [Pitangus sulphuratus]|nr:RNA-directed DNA polymerase from mobile element jockey-like protein [Pitangus sulphuratus]